MTYLHNHHMVPTYGTYFGDLILEREDPYYQVTLTEEGHACQHDILYKVFGDKRDLYAASTLYGQSQMSPEARERKRLLAGSGTPHPDQVKAMQEKAWKATSKQVILTNIDTGEETVYPSLQAAARSINGSAAALCHVIKGNRKTHLRHTARYV